MTEGKDELVWRWQASGKYTVKSMYEKMIQELRYQGYKGCGSSNYQPKSSSFYGRWHGMQYWQEIIYSWGWTNVQCAVRPASCIWSLICRCLGCITKPRTMIEFITWADTNLPGDEQLHCIGLAALCWSIWTTRNSITFNSFKLSDPVIIFYKMCSFFNVLGRPTKFGRSKGSHQARSQNTCRSEPGRYNSKPMEPVRCWSRHDAVFQVP